MNTRRTGGILLHPTSLPGRFGIGDLGPQAHSFVDWLADSGCRLWQVLPLGPTGHGNSPYQCHSVFAGNAYLISPEILLRDRLLTEADLRTAPHLDPKPGESTCRVDFGRVIPWKLSLLKTAYARFKRTASGALAAEFSRFRSENAAWLDDFSLFMALKEKYGGLSWTRWPAPIRERRMEALDQARRALKHAALRCSFSQMLFFRQWTELRNHTVQLGVRLIGDVPIFAALDSSDVWAHPELFRLDDARLPTVVAGVPPDYFAPTGQLWGNPLYRWEYHRQSGYAWWLARLRATLALVDIVRLDHFRGFAGYWEIPADAATAEAGKWMPGPAESFLDVVVQALRGDPSSEHLPLIAEDLGVITQDVIRLVQRYDLPGMRLLQFAFSGRHPDFLPDNYSENCVAYTGTHDNDTARGWYATAPELERQAALQYLHSNQETIVRDMIHAVWASRAMFAIVPIQDLLELGTEARMNYPGKPEGYWEWRLGADDLTDSLAERLRTLNTECGRSAHDWGAARGPGWSIPGEHFSAKDPLNLGP